MYIKNAVGMRKTTEIFVLGTNKNTKSVALLHEFQVHYMMGGARNWILFYDELIYKKMTNNQNTNQMFCN